MATGHKARPFPSDWYKKCRRKDCPNQATVVITATRPSRSGNPTDYVVGSYCDGCAGDLIRRVKGPKVPITVKAGKRK